MSESRRKIGLFGGTFDPIHLGHLRMALELRQQLALDEMRLLPCHQPPHRGKPGAASAQRAEMLRIALAECSELHIDERELRRDRPSYTYETLLDLRNELGAEVSLVLCMGADAFAGLPGWFRWQELLGLTHIVVITRPGWSLPESGAAAELIATHSSTLDRLTSTAAGAIVLHSPRMLPISATDIRSQIARGESAQFLVSDGVWKYIRAQGLYR